MKKKIVPMPIWIIKGTAELKCITKVLAILTNNIRMVGREASSLALCRFMFSFQFKSRSPGLACEADNFQQS